MCNVFEAIHFRKNLFNWLAHSNRAIMLFAQESAQIVQGDWKAALKIPENILKFVLEKKVSILSRHEAMLMQVLS